MSFRAKDTCLLLLVGLFLAAGVRAQEASTSRRVACVGGFAAQFACDSVDMLAHIPNSVLGPGARESLDLWGWTDPVTGKEWVLAGMNDRTVFVDISFPEDPRVVGWLRSSGNGASGWRDIKVYADHAYIVADNNGLHGLQVFDLTQLRDVGEGPEEFEMTSHYTGFGSAHNVAVNEDTGFLYVVGASGGDDCGGGLHMINVQIPDTPRFVGCYAHVGTGRALSGYTHDVQCIAYDGPDTDYSGREICIGSNETAVSISDVTVKGQPRTVAKAEYPEVAYAHQGWLTEDRRYFLLGDELDERNGTPARTLIFDVADLDDPVYVGEYLAKARSIDHNLYIQGDFAYQANYSAGLRILDVSSPEAPVEVGFFDTTPGLGSVSFQGTWSSYPYFGSGTIAVSSIGEGLFLLQSTHPPLAVGTEPEPALPTRFSVESAFPNPFDSDTRLRVDVKQRGHLTVVLVDMLGREVTRAYDGQAAAGALDVVLDGRDLAPGSYVIRIRMDDEQVTRLVTRQ